MNLSQIIPDWVSVQLQGEELQTIELRLEGLVRLRYPAESVARSVPAVLGCRY